jgi:hypothetical protein
MKKLIILSLFLVLNLIVNAQIKYTIGVNTSDNLKEVISDFTYNIETFNRYILDSNLITFSSKQHLSDDYFHNLSYEGREVISIKREITSFNFTTKTDPGGTNCESASLVCSNDAFNGTATNFGTQELNASNRGCLTSNENQSSWYYINVGTGGTLSMTINPTNASDDYDWAIWGPFTPANAAANCPPTSAPIKCSFSRCTTPTGMGNGQGCYGCGFLGLFTCYGLITGTGDSESASGDSWVSPLTVSAGQIYIMLIDNFSVSGDPYNLTWGGTAGLDCTPVVLPIELSSFYGAHANNENLLYWVSQSESNNQFYSIHRSNDGITWDLIHQAEGANNSTEEVSYKFIDRDFTKNSINYYKLSQTDYDGTFQELKVISIDNTLHDKVLKRKINLLGQEVDDAYSGIIIVEFTDGTIIKTKQ